MSIRREHRLGLADQARHSEGEWTDRALQHARRGADPGLTKVALEGAAFFRDEAKRYETEANEAESS